MEDLKKREADILEYMRQQIRDKGYPPTVREICSAVGIKSTSTAHKDIDSLVQKGYLRKDPSKPRALVVVGSNLDSSASHSNSELHNNSDIATERIDVIDIPIIGRIAAGEPILATQNYEDEFPLPAKFIGHGTNFMLRVHGDSMIEAGIFDGDYILIEEQHDARNGEIVAAMIDGFESEATVKTFYKEDNHIRLQPENSSMSPIIVNDVKILGKVKGVFRFFS